MTRFDLVLCSMTRYPDWGQGVANRNGHIARRLAEDPAIRNILFIDVPPHTLRRAVKIWLNDCIGPADNTVLERGPFHRLMTLQAPHQFRLASVEPFISGGRFCKRLTAMVRRLSFGPTVLWSYVPTYVQPFAMPEFQLKIFDAVDDWSVHESYRGIAERIRSNYRAIEQSADVIFTVSRELTGLFAKNPETHWIPNGVDIDHFARPSAPSDAERLPEGSPLILYTGVIQERVDIPLIGWLAAERPGYRFVLIGPVWKGVDVRPLQLRANVSLLGRVSYDRLPAYLQQGSVGIVPHRSDAFVRSMNPLKVYEYLAAGLPVVATDIPDLQGLSRGVAIAGTRQEFLQNLDAAVSDPPSHEVLRSLIVNETWEHRYQAMKAVLDRRLAAKNPAPSSHLHGGTGIK